MPIERTFSLWAVGPNEVFWNGEAAGLKVWNGSRWGVFGTLTGTGTVRGTGPNDIWVVFQNTIHRGNFATHPWTTTTFPFPVQALDGLWLIGPDDGWIVGTVIAGADAGRVILRSTLYHWNGTTWSPVASPLDGQDSGRFAQIWAGATNDVWAAVAGGLLHWDGRSWTRSSLPPPGNGATGTRVNALWGTSTGDVWAGGADTSGAKLWHFDGARWTDSAFTATGEINILWGSCPTNFWASSGPGLWRLDGGVWSAVPMPGVGRVVGAISGNGPDDVWVATNSAPTSIMHWRPGACGDGVIQKWETCDFPGSQFCTGCQPNMCASCFGVRCNPRACDSLTGVELSECQAVRTCVTAGQSTCLFSGSTSGNCYCNQPGCTGGVNGPCARQYEAVANSTDPAEVLRQINTPGTVAAQLTEEGRCFGSSQCGVQCSIVSP
jgi:hypothetical protein